MTLNMKNWSVEIEKPIVEKWKKSNQFKFNVKTKKKIYSIDTPPPYINAPIHIGHATTYAYQDFFARFWRMKGCEVLFPLGLDRNGLPIELGAEKKFKVSPFVVGRKKFVELCKKMLEKTTMDSTDTFAKLGISFNSYKLSEDIGSVYMTDSDDYRTLTQMTFVDLYKKNLIYEDSRINNWDSKLQTTIADSEIDYVEKETLFNDVKWKVKETGEEIVIGTTRPELICSCGMVIFNPKDGRYKHLEDKTAISPIFEKEVPIKSHLFAQVDKGTGLVMMCSAGDVTDIQFFREQRLKPVISIGMDGKMNKNAGFLKGLKVAFAREKITQELKDRHLLVKQEKITHRTPISERSKVDVEFIEMPEFYVKQLDVKDKIKKLAEKIDFFPESSRKILNDWIDSISIDWPVSRRRFYATEIPLWYSGDLVAVPTEKKYYQPWKDSVPKNAEVFELSTPKGVPRNIFEKKMFTKGKVSDKKFKDLKWKGEGRVFDTWFDSSISELFILGYGSKKSIFDKAYPVSLRPQGKEIVRTWLYYTLLRSYYETGKMPFESAWIHQHILDNKGIKMSKSLGNVVDPQNLISEFGAEAFRLWAATEGDLSKIDLRCSKDRIRGELKTLNKFLNVSKFVFMFDKPKKKPKLEKLDELFIDYIEDLTKFSEKHYEKYDFYNPSVKLRYFLWEIFASHYIEVVKSRAYNQEKKFSKSESDSARYSLYFLLERLLVLLYPVIPQITTTIGKELGIDLLKIGWPKIAPQAYTKEVREPPRGPEPSRSERKSSTTLKSVLREKKDFSTKGKIYTKGRKSNLKLVEKIMNFNSEIWKQKKEKGISLRDEILEIEIPKNLKNFEKDLVACHKIV
ncbi:MAG: class I tRNA ligase family protein [Nanoarchaeota archaeon]